MDSRRTLHCWTVTLALALGVAVVPLLATPAQAAEPSAADKETARALMDQGDRAFQAKSFAAALKAYKAAHAIMGIPNTGIWVAKAQEALGQLVEARDTALDVMRMPKQPGERPQAERARAEAAKLTERLAARIPSIQVKLEGLVEGVQVTVKLDGRVVPTEAASMPLKVNPGTHRLGAIATGYRDATNNVTVTESENVVANLRLVPESEPAAAATPGARGLEPDLPSSANEGKSTSSGISPLVFIGFGLAAAGIGVGTASGVIALSKASEAKAMCTDSKCPPAAQDPIDVSNTWANVSNVTFGVGVIGVGLGIAGIVLSAKSSGKVARTAIATPVRPWVGIGSAGISGSF